MKIIAVVAQKGGVGKTTFAQCLAVEALRQGMAAAIIDTDPQQSAGDWGQQRERIGVDAPAVIPLGSRSLSMVTKQLADRGAALMVIDTPPHSAPAINAAANVIFLVAGEEKTESLHEILRGPSQPAHLPAQLISPKEGSLTWMVDAAAATRLRVSSSEFP